MIQSPNGVIAAGLGCVGVLLIRDLFALDFGFTFISLSVLYFGCLL